MHFNQWMNQFNWHKLQMSEIIVLKQKVDKVVNIRKGIKIVVFELKWVEMRDSFRDLVHLWIEVTKCTCQLTSGKWISYPVTISQRKPSPNTSHLWKASSCTDCGSIQKEVCLFCIPSPQDGLEGRSFTPSVPPQLLVGKCLSAGGDGGWKLAHLMDINSQTDCNIQWLFSCVNGHSQT